MQPLKAHVHKGRLLLDEPTDLPEGEVVELVAIDEALARGGDGLDDEDRTALHRELDVRSASMPSTEEDDLEIPELSPEWFKLAVQPNRQGLRRGAKRAVFIDDEVAKRFGSDEELEQALRALLQASDHVRRTG